MGIIVALAWPTMVEQLLHTAVQYIDTAMVGSLGTGAVAAVGATTTVNWLIGSTLSALGVGFLAYIAKAMGAGEESRARRASMQAVLTVLAVGTLFTVLTLGLSGIIPVWMQTDESIRTLAGNYFFILYLPMLPRTASIILGTVLRAAGDTKTPMKVGIAVNIINVVLNFFMIYPVRTVVLFGAEFTVYGLGWGVLGAAAASAIAFAVGGAVTSIILWRHPRISPKGCAFRPESEILRPCLRVALPNMLQRFGTSLGYVAFAAMINSLGETATAAHTVANTVESAFYIPGFGMQTAAATLTGNAYGAGDGKRMYALARRFIPLEIGLMTVSGAILFILAPTLMSIFSDSTDVIALGATVLRMVALSEPFYGVSIVIEGMLQGIGQTRTPFIFNLVGMWGVRIVGTAVCIGAFGLGLVSAWGCMIAHNLMLCLSFVIYWKKGKWNPLEALK